ncbi:MAG: BadF/BadG/BcrA/BcrD ATPase family protein, partial [Acutalibacteraceae bacterium]
MRLGIDIGSTTLKYVLLNDDGEIICKDYSRHFSKISEKLRETLDSVSKFCKKDEPLHCTISGSAGMGIAESTGIPFVQEVYATRLAVNTLIPGTDVVIELGGEDAKILYLTDGLEVRMNGSCAGGTGAFIDQMATLLNITPTELNELASKAEKNYTIASRCGVFAKSDIQPLLNQGASKSDIS